MACLLLSCIGNLGVSGIGGVDIVGGKHHPWDPIHKRKKRRRSKSAGDESLSKSGSKQRKYPILICAIDK